MTIESIRVSSYISSDCSGDLQSSKDLTPQPFDVEEMLASSIDIKSSSLVLGDHSPSNVAFFRFTPKTTMSKSGSGEIRI